MACHGLSGTRATGRDLLTFPGLGKKSYGGGGLDDSMGPIRLILLEPSGRKHVVVLDRETVTLPRLGVVRAESLVASIGKRWTVVGRSFLVLANAVGPNGRVVSYDLRPEFLDVAQRNVSAAGLEERVEFKVGDGRVGIPETDADAFVVDIPDPWETIGNAASALRPCGHFASYSPNMEQVSRTVAALRAGPFVEIRTLEIIEREIEASDSGTRPSFAPLGHTGYLTFARKVLDTF